MKKIILTAILISTISFSILDARTARTVAYSGPKKAGMGGCGVAILDKRESLYYNPAAIVDLDNALVIPLIQSSSIVGVDVLSNMQKFADAAGEAQGNSDTAAALDIYKTMIPTRIGYGFASAGHFIGNTGFGLENLASHWSIGTFSNFKLGANMLNRISPRLEAIGYFDVVFPTLTFAKAYDAPQDFFIQNPKFGLTIKNINRYSLYNADTGSETFTVEVLNMISSDTDTKMNMRQGQGVGLDIGMIGDIETFMGPGKLGFAVTNLSTWVTGKQYEDISSDNGKVVTNYKEQIPVLGTVGVAVKASPFEKIGFLDAVLPDATYAVDIDVIAPYSSMYKKLHLGIEQLYFNELMALRMGLNQGYPTMGVNFNFGVYHIGLTYYTEEFGREIGDNPQSFYYLDGGFYL